MNVVILGPPGSGKGTQARIIANHFSLSVVDTGKILRDSVLSDPELLKTINQGYLLSDGIVIKIVEEHLISILGNFILDGFPRTIAQAEFLKQFMLSRHQHIDAVIRMVIEDDLIIQRLVRRFVCNDCGAIFTECVDLCPKCGSTEIKQRADDADHQAIRSRILQYKKDVQCLDNFFDLCGIKVFNIEASGSVEQVTANIENVLPLC